MAVRNYLILATYIKNSNPPRLELHDIANMTVAEFEKAELRKLPEEEIKTPSSLHVTNPECYIVTVTKNHEGYKYRNPLNISLDKALHNDYKIFTRIRLHHNKLQQLKLIQTKRLSQVSQNMVRNLMFVGELGSNIGAGTLKNIHKSLSESLECQSTRPTHSRLAPEGMQIRLQEHLTQSK